MEAVTDRGQVTDGANGGSLFRVERLDGRTGRLPWTMMEELNWLWPNDVEWVEEVQVPAVILRIYTRDFIQEMMSGGVRLGQPILNGPVCR